MQKEQELLNQLIQERNIIDERINNGKKIIEAMKLKEKQQKIENARAKIDNNVWDEWLLKLAKRMIFEGIFHGDLVSIGVCGKRPFGNSSINEDIAEILGWDYEDELSEEQYLLIEKIWEDLPVFLNKLISTFNNKTK